MKQGLGLYYYKKENATLEEDFFVRNKGGVGSGRSEGRTGTGLSH